MPQEAVSASENLRTALSMFANKSSFASMALLMAHTVFGRGEASSADRTRVRLGVLLDVHAARQISLGLSCFTRTSSPEITLSLESSATVLTAMFPV